MSLRETVHATCVALAGSGALILGPSGSGKSGLALQLVALGAALVADDRTTLERRGAQVWAMPRPGFEGRIEARFLGLLRVPHHPEVPVSLVINLGETERERLPPPRRATLLGLSIPLVLRVEAAHFPSAVICLLKSGPLA